MKHLPWILALASGLFAVERSGLMKPGEVMDFPGYRIQWTNSADTRQVQILDETVTYPYGLEKTAVRSREEWGLDAKGLQVSRKIWNGDGSFQGGVTNAPDPSGFVNESTHWRGLSETRFRWVYQRTNVPKPGLITEETRYGADGRIEARNTYQYDGQGRETNILMYHANGLLEFRRTQAFDNAGNLAEQVLYRATGTIQDRVTNTWTNALPLTESVYDIEGVLVRKVVYGHTNLTGGPRILSQKIYRGLGDLREQTTYIYDPQGRLVQSRTTDGGGLFRSSSSNTYDAQGRKTEEVVFASATTPSYKLVFLYDAKGRATELSRLDYRARFGGESWETTQRVRLQYTDGSKP